MKLALYKKSLKQPLGSVTEVFLLRDNQVCLGLKKRGFGQGKYVGIGGKVETETIVDAACREVFEEIDVRVSPSDLIEMGIVHFYFPHIHDESWNQVASVFVAKQWKGEPYGKVDDQGLVEIEPIWLPSTAIPFERMWDDAHFWLPQMLAGKKIAGEFLFDEHLKVVDYTLDLS